MNKGDVDKAKFDLLTMVDTRGAWRKQASNIPRDGAIFDPVILLQFKSTLYQAITEHKIISRQSCEGLIYYILRFTHRPAL
jgi:hypothetical protein